MITETDPTGVQPSRGFAENTENFVTRLLPTSRGARPEEAAAGPNTGAHGAPNTAPACDTTPTLADLELLYRGRDRLLRAAEVAEQLGVSTATVYKICKTGELPHIRIIDTIRVRSDDLAEFVVVRRCRSVD
jgi:excisionase family DNA binding protein